MTVKKISFELVVGKFDRCYLMPNKDQFVDRLIIEDESSIPKAIATDTNFVCLFDIDAVEFNHFDDRFGHFLSELKTQCIDTAKWLQQQPAKLFDELRQLGYETRVDSFGWLNMHQLFGEHSQDISVFPSEFLFACKRLGLILQASSCNPKPSGLLPGDLLSSDSK